MGWQTITYQCGHQEEKQMYGPYAERDRKAEWMGRDFCPECRAKKAAEQSAAAGLPELTGSPKQIAWAQTVRDQLMISGAAVLEQFKTRIKIESDHDVYVRCEQVWHEYISETRAGVWIDRRNDDLMVVIRNGVLAEAEKRVQMGRGSRGG